MAQNYSPRGKMQHPLYKTWRQMKARCAPSNLWYNNVNYAGRNIRVCDRWLGKDGFDNFINDMGPKPSPKHSIDRKNNDKGYSPDNCQWATYFQQRMNQQPHRLSAHPGVREYTYKGVTRWIAYMNFEGVRVLYEYFDTFDDAWAARKAAEKKYIHS